MNYRKLGKGLGIFSLALGTVELLAASRIARALDVPAGKGVVRAFGAREVVGGLGILAAPTHSAGVWGRVAGDALDLAALGASAAKAPRNRTVWGSLAFVIAAAALDVFVARGLDRTAGRTSPLRAAAPA